MSSLTSAQILEFFEYPDPGMRSNDSGVWILGCVEIPRITVVSQQNRAFTLVNALFNSGRAKRGQSFGVVGGGIAGVTAACALRSEGGRVELFEKEEPLSLFASATHRWLHPGLFNWPQSGWQQTDTHLPLLNWGFAPAAGVASKIFEQFSVFSGLSMNDDESAKIRVEHHEVTFRGFRNGRPQVGNKAGQIFAFDHLIIAVGFGLETCIANTTSYWKPDDIDISSGRTIIIGVGDGGLMDSLRVRLKDFNEQVIVNDFLTNWNSSEREQVERQIIAFETDTRQHRSDTSITEFYTRLQTPRADNWFRARLRPDTSLIVVARSEAPCTSKASPINRFLFSRLQKVDSAVQFESATFHPEEAQQSWRLVFDDGRQLTSDNLVGRLILRTGPKSSLGKFSSAIAEYANHNLKPRSTIDFHRQYIWSDGRSNIIVDSSSPIVQDAPSPDMAFHQWINSRLEEFFGFVMGDLKRADLLSKSPHKWLIETLPSEQAALRRIGRRRAQAVDRLFNDDAFSQGQIPRELQSRLLSRKWIIACPSILVGAAACLLHLRRLGCEVELRFDAVQAVDFLLRADQQSAPPDVIAGLDGLAVAALTNRAPMYYPICGSLASEMCLLVSDLSAFSNQDRGEIIIPSGDINSLILADEAALSLLFQAQHWKRVSENYSRMLGTLVNGGDKAVAVFTYGLQGFAAEQFGLGSRVNLLKASSKLSGFAQEDQTVVSAKRATTAPGAIVLRRDLVADAELREAFIVAFLSSYRELRQSKEILKKTVQMLLDLPEYRTSLSITLGFPLLTRDY